MNFRRCITALALLTLFAGLAAAQNYGSAGGAMTCDTVAQVTPTIRAEGVTELVGDIVITCQGGNASASSSIPIPQGNIVISLSAPVTSRLATGGVPLGANGTPSEALLLIDEPNSGIAAPVAGYGPAAPLGLCTSAIGCVEYPTLVNTSAGNYIVATATQHTSSSSSPYTGAADPGANVFQGNVLGNLVSFQGIPFLPPVTSGIVRVYRITNIRVNATGLAGTSLAPITASISTNGQSTLALLTPNVTVAYATNSMTPTLTTGSAGPLCTGQNTLNAATLNFKELIPNAFKTRVAPVGTNTYSSYLGTSSAAYYMQNAPGQLYSSESGFIFPATGVQAGLADFGTRFKATFANLPSGMTVYVSGTNVITSPNYAPGLPGSFYAPEPSYAVLLASSVGEAGVFAQASSTGLVALSGAAPMAVWEVLNTNTSAIENFQFTVQIAYAANVPPLTNVTGLTTPAPTGTPSVTLAYAPTSTNAGPSVGAYTTSTAIPRFAPGNGVLNGIIQIVPCQTLLLFPYVTSQAGFDTGISISNTSADPWSTLQTTGYCTLNFYGANAPTTATQTPVIPPGTEWASTAYSYVPFSGAGTGFAGYIFATCNFQFAHGFAFVSDYGARNIAMGYLALIVTNGTPQSTFRGSGASVQGENLNN
jgi:hypothetical protein